MQEDRELIAQFLSGDQRAFDQLVLRHQERVRQFMYRATGNEEDTHDLAQEVFIKAYHNLHRFRGDSELSTWLYRISSNALNTHFRRQRLRTWLPLGDAAEPVTQGPDEDRQDQRRRLLAQLPRLSAQERQVVILRALQELSVAETASIVGTSENVVKVAYHTAKNKLKGLLSGD